MRSALTYASLLGLGTSASAIVPHVLSHDGQPKFTLEAHGKAAGKVGQLMDGQNRIGGKYPVAEFQLVKDGKKGGFIVDGKGRGCIITPPNTTQWQCDQGAKGVTGFEITCDNKLLYKGSPDFWACPVNDYGEWNIYIRPDFGQKKCTPITLTIHGGFDGKKDDTCKNDKPAPPPCKDDECKNDKPTPPPCKDDTCKNDKPSPPACKDDSCKNDKPAPPPCKDDACKNDACNNDKPADDKLVTSSQGRCGAEAGQTCIGFAHGGCCSSYGWCGPTKLHCGVGCQEEFGTCDKPAPPAPCDESKDKCGKPTPPKPEPPKPAPCENGSDDENEHSAHHCRQHCPLDLAGPFEFPHLIVPVDSAKPEKNIGNKLNGELTESVCTVFNFDINPRLAGKTCSLAWLFPEKKDLETSDFDFNPTGKKPELTISRLHNAAGHDTTWKTLGDKDLIATGPARPGVSWVAQSEECRAGQRVSYLLCGKDFKLNYFQDFNPSPIGLYLRAC